MEHSRKNPSILNRTIAIPESSSSRSKEKSDHNIRDFDLNQPVPEIEEELAMQEAEDTMKLVNNMTQPKKLRLSLEQTNLLEESFNQNPILDSVEKEQLAAKVMLSPRQVEVWFQNHRARSKVKKMEKENICMKRQYELLIGENLRLHQELEQLRSLKMAPATSTFSTCPCCGYVILMSSEASTSLQPNPPSIERGNQNT